MFCDVYFWQRSRSWRAPSLYAPTVLVLETSAGYFWRAGAPRPTPGDVSNPLPSPIHGSVAHAPRSLFFATPSLSRIGSTVNTAFP